MNSPLVLFSLISFLLLLSLLLWLGEGGGGVVNKVSKYIKVFRYMMEHVGDWSMRVGSSKVRLVRRWSGQVLIFSIPGSGDSSSARWRNGECEDWQQYSVHRAGSHCHRVGHHVHRAGGQGLHDTGATAGGAWSGYLWGSASRGQAIIVLWGESSLQEYRTLQ